MLPVSFIYAARAVKNGGPVKIPTLPSREVSHTSFASLVPLHWISREEFVNK